MRFYFHEHAETEFDSVVEYYEDCRRGLGIEFAQEVNAAIARIIQHPEAWSPLSKNTRRCLVNRFPFGVIYKFKSTSLSLQLPIFDGALAIGYTECEQNLSLHFPMNVFTQTACFKLLLPLIPKLLSNCFCPKCSGVMRGIAFMEEPDVIKKILNHLRPVEYEAKAAPNGQRPAHRCVSLIRRAAGTPCG